jgi:hypothetical protein
MTVPLKRQTLRRQPLKHQHVHDRDTPREREYT